MLAESNEPDRRILARLKHANSQADNVREVIAIPSPPSIYIPDSPAWVNNRS